MALVPWTYNNPRLELGRQQQVRQFIFQGHVVEVIQDTDAEIDATKNTALKLWDGAFLLARYLENTGAFPPAGFWSGRRCIELGAGCGLVGIVAWLLGADVTLTDLPSAIQHLQRCVTANVDRLSLSVPELAARSSSIRVEDYEWGNTEALAKLNVPYDVVFGSDIVYSPQAAKPLVDALTVVSNSSTMILFSYKPRGLGEDVFFTLLETNGFAVNKIPKEFHPVDFLNSDYDILSVTHCKCL